MDFFGIGPLELVFILVVALVVLGPNRMIDAARTLGKYVKELQRATSEVPRLLSLDEEPSPSLPPRQSISEESSQPDEEDDGATPKQEQ